MTTADPHAPLKSVKLDQAAAWAQAAATLLPAGEAQLHAILDHIPAAIYILSPDHRYLFVNRYFEQDNQISNAEICGLSVYDRFPPEVAAGA